MDAEEQRKQQDALNLKLHAQHQKAQERLAELVCNTTLSLILILDRIGGGLGVLDEWGGGARALENVINGI